jgi:hypothetical protein
MVWYDRLAASAKAVYAESRRIEREIATWGLRGGNWPMLMRVCWYQGGEEKLIKS